MNLPDSAISATGPQADSSDKPDESACETSQTQSLWSTQQRFMELTETGNRQK